MILVDANLLIYASVTSFPQHEAARVWLDSRLNAAERVGLPWPSILAFLRIVTNSRVFERPASVEDAWRQVVGWLACDSVWVPGPGDRHAGLFEAFLRLPFVRGNLIPDAHLAALAVEHGLVLCSSDSDFSHFPGLAWQNPLG